VTLFRFNAALSCILLSGLGVGAVRGFAPPRLPSCKSADSFSRRSSSARRLKPKEKSRREALRSPAALDVWIVTVLVGDPSRRASGSRWCLERVARPNLHHTGVALNLRKKVRPIRRGIQVPQSRIAGHAEARTSRIDNCKGLIVGDVKHVPAEL
jgi:hypothetical protein